MTQHANPTPTDATVQDVELIAPGDGWPHTPPGPTANDWSGRRRALMCLALAAAIVVAYWGVWHNGFVYFDDPQYITNNVIVKLGLTKDSVVWAFTAYSASNWHPLTWISHMADISIYGIERPGGHHVTNLLLHAANSCLLFWLLAAMTRAYWRSALVAALFALHPMHVESVAWVAERKDVLSAFVGLLTIGVYLRYARQPRIWLYLAVVALFAVGLLCKPMLVTLPCVLLLLDFWPLERVPFDCRKPFIASTWKKIGLLGLEKLPLFVLSAVSSHVTFLAQHHCGSVAPMDKLTLATRFGNAAVAYMRYIGKLFWPGDMTMFYPYQELSTLKVVAAAALLLAISLGVLALLWFHRKYALVGWLWYLGMLVPVIGFVQVGEQAFADRYTYLPYIGLFIILVWGLTDALGWFRAGRVALVAAAAAVLCLCTYKTNAQMPYWRTSFSLLTRALEIERRNAPILNNMGVLKWEEGDREGALAYWRECLTVRPDWVDAQNNYGVALQSLGHLEEAIRWFEMARANSLVAVDARVNLGRSLWDLRKDRRAIEVIQEAFVIEPNHLDGHTALGAIYLQTGELEKSVQHYLHVLRLAPNRADVAKSAGDILIQLGRMQEAMDAYRLLLAKTPNDHVLMNNIAWTMATYHDPQVRNGTEAVALAQRALELLGAGDPNFLINYLSTLAASLAEAGRFPEAVQTVDRAIALAGARNDIAQIRKLEDRKRLFLANGAYHEPPPPAPLARPAAPPAVPAGTR